MDIERDNRDSVAMPAFQFRCPDTGMNVQGWFADDPNQRDDLNYEVMPCLACGGNHVVNPKTGKTIGNSEKPRRP